MKNIKWLVFILVCICLAGIIAGCSQKAGEATQPEQTEQTEQTEQSAVPAEKVTLKAIAGGVGGGWYTVLAGISEVVGRIDSGINMQTVPGGGLINPPRVGTKDVDMGLVFPPFLKTAYEGTAPFDTAYPDLRGLMKGFGVTYAQFVVAEESGLTSIKDVIDKKYPIKVAVDRVGTTDEWLFSKLLAFYNVDYKTIESWGGKVTHAGYGDQAVLYKDGHVDAIFGNIAVPWTAAMEANIAKKIKILPLDEDLQKYLMDEFAFGKGEISAGSYGDDVVTEAIPTVTSLTALMVHKDVPEDVVYRITKIICENVDDIRATHDSAKEFDPKNEVWKDVGAPLHPGAEKYYKEAGFIQ
ncbi:MAG: TAXI family TRAP transporter solute-binding subunit [Dehalobacterium sp.]